METVGASVVAECANQYGDLQDEVGDLRKKQIEHFFYIIGFPMQGVLMILRLVETWLRAGPPHTPQVKTE